MIELVWLVIRNGSILLMDLRYKLFLFMASVCLLTILSITAGNNLIGLYYRGTPSNLAVDIFPYSWLLMTLAPVLLVIEPMSNLLKKHFVSTINVTTNITKYYYSVNAVNLTGICNS